MWWTIHGDWDMMNDTIVTLGINPTSILTDRHRFVQNYSRYIRETQENGIYQWNMVNDTWWMRHVDWYMTNDTLVTRTLFWKLKISNLGTCCTFFVLTEVFTVYTEESIALASCRHSSEYNVLDKRDDFGIYDDYIFSLKPKALNGPCLICIGSSFKKKRHLLMTYD